MNILKIVTRLVYLIVFSVLGQVSFCQQLPIYSQYLYNKFLINPAHAGSDGYTSYNITIREQWIGYSGAPRTYSLSYQTRILKRGYRLDQNIFNNTVYRSKTPAGQALEVMFSVTGTGLFKEQVFRHLTPIICGFRIIHNYHWDLA